MKFKNLTPYPLNIFDGNNTLVLSLSPTTLLSTKIVWRQVTKISGVPIFEAVGIKPPQLPPPKNGVGLIVLLSVAMEMKAGTGDSWRKDVFVPAELERGGEGQIVGCIGLERV